jgi:hypothetical protein
MAVKPDVIEMSHERFQILEIFIWHFVHRSIGILIYVNRKKDFETRTLEIELENP